MSETLFLESILIRSSTGRAEKRKEPEEVDESEKVGNVKNENVKIQNEMKWKKKLRMKINDSK